MESPIFWVTLSVIVLLLVGLRLRNAVKGWRWQKENPEKAWQNWLNGGF